MPFTLVSFAESQDEAGAFAAMTATADQHVRTAGDSLFVPDYNVLLGAAAFVGTVGNMARLVGPSLRRVNPYYINPVEELLVPGNPAVHGLFPGVAVPLDAGEQLQAENNANPAAAEQHTVMVWLGSGPIQPQSGAIRTLRGQITLAVAAGAWTFSPIDWVDEIPVGQYTVVGGHVIAAGAVAWRLSFVGQWHRPGGLVAQVDDQAGLDIFRAGWLGAWGSFTESTPPVVELIGSAAAGAATYEMFLDIMV